MLRVSIFLLRSTDNSLNGLRHADPFSSPCTRMLIQGECSSEYAALLVKGQHNLQNNRFITLNIIIKYEKRTVLHFYNDFIECLPSIYGLIISCNKSKKSYTLKCMDPTKLIMSQTATALIHSVFKI